MNLKGISIIEQHVEKIVLGVSGLILLGVFAWQFVGNPNAVQIGSQKFSPEQAPDQVREMAKQVRGKLDAAVAPAIPEQPSVLGEVKRGLTSDAFDVRPVLLAGRSGSAAISTTPLVNSSTQNGVIFAEFLPPAPASPAAAVHEGTIDPVVPMLVKDAAKYLPAQQPLDLRSVSVQGTLSPKLIRDLLESRPSDAKISPVPATWWQARVELLDVELERETLQPDGSWGQLTSVPSFPGAFTLREKLQSDQTRPADLASILDGEKANREAIRRPAYWQTISGAPWTAPALGVQASASLPDAVARKVREIKGKKDELNRIVTQIQNIDRPRGGQPGAPNPGAPGGGNPPGGGGGPGGAGGGGGGGGRDGRDGQASRGESDPHRYASSNPNPSFDFTGIFASDELPSYFTRDLWAQGGGPPKPGEGGGPGGGNPPPAATDRNATIKLNLEKRRDQLSKDIEKLVEDLQTEGYTAEGRRIALTENAPFVEPLVSATESTADTITVWAHDVTAQPGSTYRYRLVGWFTNPMFGNLAGLDDSQKPMAARPAIRSTPSEWTSNIVIAPRVQYAINSAKEAGQVGAGTAAIQTEASASGEIFEFYYGFWRSGTIDLKPGDRVAAAVKLPDLSLYEIPTNEAGNPDLAALKKLPAPKSIEPSIDSFLLDVVPTGGLSGGASQAVLRGNAGRIELVSAGASISDEELARLRQSASMGTSAVPSEPRLPGPAGSGGPSGTPNPGGGRPPEGTPPPGAPPRPSDRPPPPTGDKPRDE